ncbi:transposase [Methylophaga sp.]|uniref:transposase n=1 Tax=Methylophaga sp. TaxID=2024840 RepID=UPI00176D50DC|nr:transposase [Methylophaga sp.]HIC46590.1 transposase [Methylophaga sp.]
MPRRLRVSIPGYPEHIIQRGNNRQPTFASNEDFKAYIYWLREYAKKYEVSVHAWVLMTNHVHVLCTPNSATGISKMMQSLGRQYVRYFNSTYQRTGTLWEGRFRSCLVQDESYLFHLYRYIELNPVRANMVNDPSEYSWSSYQCNALGARSDLLTPHDCYVSLGSTEEERCKAYRNMFRYHVDGALLEDIRMATHKGLALGNDKFKKHIEALSGQRQTEGKRGRKVGWRKKTSNR